jgi:hypothetical protein
MDQKKTHRKLIYYVFYFVVIGVVLGKFYGQGLQLGQDREEENSILQGPWYVDFSHSAGLQDTEKERES